jgi:hypothetical protein
MLFAVTNATKKMLVLILQDIISRHPFFADTVQVYTKFPEIDRPKMAIVVRAASAGGQKLAFDNFVTTDHSFCTLANLKGVAGRSIEWVKDDVKNIDKMSAPGFYVVRITEHQENSNEFKFVIDPYLFVEETLNIQFLKNTDGAILSNIPINPKTEVIYSQKNQFDFKPDLDYTIDYTTGEILFKSEVKQYEPIICEYQVLGTEQGPFITEYYKVDNKAIPGVAISFGDRLKVGDEQVVFIDKAKKPVALVHGGQWILQVSCILLCQDPDNQERLADYVMTALWSEYQTRLTNSGLNILEFNISAEAEDLENEVGEEYSFTASIDMQIETYWELHTPLITELRRISFAYGEESYKDKLDYNTQQEEYEIREFDDRMVSNRHNLGLQLVPSLDPYTTQPAPFPIVKTRKY